MRSKRLPVRILRRHPHPIENLDTIPTTHMHMISREKIWVPDKCYPRPASRSGGGSQRQRLFCRGTFLEHKGEDRLLDKAFDDLCKVETRPCRGGSDSRFAAQGFFKVPAVRTVVATKRVVPVPSNSAKPTRRQWAIVWWFGSV